LKRDYAARTDGSNTHNAQSRSEELVQNVIEIAEEKKAHNVVALDVRELTVLTDYFVLASADNETAIRSLSNAVVERLAQKGFKNPWHVEGTAGGGWIVLDYAYAVVHIFHDSTREFYDLEGLWGDAPRFAG
jgi:ribosome-associated protein